MWRRRHWRKLLNLIDRLPRNTYFQQALSLDEEYAESLFEAGLLDDDGSGSKWAPPMSTYTAETEAMWSAVNEIRLLRTALIAVNSETAPKQPQLVPGPETVFDMIKSRTQQRRHEALVARVLPHKRKK